MERGTSHRARCCLLRRHIYRRAALLLVPSILGCGGVVGSGPPPPPPAVVVTVAPSNASVPLGEPQTFTASVANATNTAVTWSVNGVAGGSAATGTITASGVYTAPGSMPSPAGITVQATSAADTSASSSAAVTVTSDISVSISPPSAPVELGATQSFLATVSSSANPNRAVTWSVSGPGCSGAACGSVDASGNYTAPQILLASPPSVTLTATSIADPTKSGAAAIGLTSTFSLSISGPATLTAGTTATYAAALTPVPNSNPSRVITWSVTGNGCAGTACGTITSSGVYTAPGTPPATPAVQVVATPQADPSKAASLSVSILPAVTISLSPSAATVPLGNMQSIAATVAGSSNTAVTWDVNGVVGGNAALGTILNPQTNSDTTIYSAPQSEPAGGTVTIDARSIANPAIAGTATITFTPAIGVTLTPASATLAINHRQTFAVQVTGTSNENVSWQVNGIAGGSASAGQICVTGSNPCQPVTATNGGSVDYVAPAGVPSPNPVSITATSQANTAESASVAVTILPHILVSVQPANLTMVDSGQLRFVATVTGTADQQVFWAIQGAGCGATGACGTIDSSGLFSAPASAPSPDQIGIVATSAENSTQSGTAVVSISAGPGIFALSPTSAYAGSAGGFTLLVSGNNFSPSNPGPGATLLVAGTARATSCVSATQCITSLSAADLASAATLSVQLQNPNGLLSNSVNFVVLASGNDAATIPLTPSSPTSLGNNIVVVDLSTNGGSGAEGNVSLNIGAIGPYSEAASSCTVGGTAVAIQRPASGTATADVCVFSVSGLDPSFLYTITGPPTPDITIVNREPLGLGMLHLTLEVPASAAAGPRTLFVQNPELDLAAGSGAIEVQ